jgi:adenylate cyclase
MGPPKTPLLTALGDALNTAARLENITKELHQPVVVSHDTLEASGLFAAEMPLHDVRLRGRSTPLAVAALNKESLGELLRGSKYCRAAT